MVAAGARGSENGRERLPAFLTPPFLRTIGVVALVALAGEVLLMPRLVDLDAALWRAILYWRQCGVDRAVDHAVDLTTRVAIGALLAAALVRARIDGVRRVWPSLAVCLVGLYAGKLLKNVFMRERPSMLPGPIVGHSFPSAHVMNTALAAIAIVVLAAAFRHPRRWWAASCVMVAIIFLGRLLLAHHWMLDAIGGLLAAVALNGLALPVVRRRPLVAPAALALAITAALVLVTRVPALKMRLPSPLSVHEQDDVEVQIADALASGALEGDWHRAVEHFRRGRFLWLDGPGAVTFTVPERLTRVAGDSAALPAASLVFAGRPDFPERPCLSARVLINGRELRRFVPYVGWREYRLPLPPRLLHTGRNDVRFEITDAVGAPWRFAMTYVRVAFD